MKDTLERSSLRRRLQAVEEILGFLVGADLVNEEPDGCIFISWGCFLLLDG